jgi:hypothetical protein
MGKWKAFSIVLISKSGEPVHPGSSFHEREREGAQDKKFLFEANGESFKWELSLRPLQTSLAIQL